MEKLGFKLCRTEYRKTHPDGSHWMVSNASFDGKRAPNGEMPITYWVPTKQSQRVGVDFNDAEGRNLCGLYCAFGALLTKAVELNGPFEAVLVPNPTPKKEKRHAKA